MLWFSNSTWSHMPVLNLLRGKETDGDKRIFASYFQIILVVFQISMAGSVKGIWEVVEKMDERHLEGCLGTVFNPVTMDPDSPLEH